MRPAAPAVAGLVLACLVATIAARPVHAECAFLDPWPAFADVAAAAETVILGEVVEDRTPNGDGGGRLEHFGLQVEAVFRGDVYVGAVVDVAFLAPGPPPVLCPDTYLRPLLGEVIAIAIGAPGPNGTTLNSAAWVTGAPDEMQHGLAAISRQQLRALFDLPVTDTFPDSQGPEPLDAPWLFVGVAALGGGLMGLLRTRRPGRPENRR